MSTFQKIAAVLAVIAASMFGYQSFASSDATTSPAKAAACCCGDNCQCESCDCKCGDDCQCEGCDCGACECDGQCPADAA